MKLKIDKDAGYVYVIYNLDKEDSAGIEFTKKEIDFLRKAEDLYDEAQAMLNEKYKEK